MRDMRNGTKLQRLTLQEYCLLDRYGNFLILTSGNVQFGLKKCNL